MNKEIREAVYDTLEDSVGVLEVEEIEDENDYLADVIADAVEEVIEKYFKDNRMLCKGCGYQMCLDDIHFL